ncbi:hypothetical protein GALMADRAFT_61902 [Galerina marginata CBS 339.88]|uniref:Uncharacterized protein n=1 Tax=Galerina marginata (strain CBS 339.88) TaxID=685588 RepID=A0A067TLE1_GALM3|nr:hypothetical protein GALMADRAFT_61902 [Galerina marginata CBS 339.88]
MTALIDNVRYNNLPSLAEADITRQVAFVDNAVNGPIRDVFLKHGAHLSLCLYLQHRHHSVGVGEAIVKVEGTAHLMDSQAIEEIISFGNKVVPTTWMASDGKVLPMEFAVVPAANATPVLTPAFLFDFLSVLATSGCDGLFGIDTIAKNAWAEMTIGNASVVVPSNGSDTFDGDKFIPVAFAFSEDEPKFKVHGRCGSNHRHTSKPVTPPPTGPKTN